MGESWPMVAHQTVNLASFGIPTGSIPVSPTHGSVTQLVEYSPLKREVGGSIPPGPTEVQQATEVHMTSKQSCGAKSFASVAQG